MDSPAAAPRGAARVGAPLAQLSPFPLAHSPLQQHSAKHFFYNAGDKDGKDLHIKFTLEPKQNARTFFENFIGAFVRVLG